ncbi:MAG TPA: AMP-binding protein [Steroidobacteraceae bacterium]|nr:AMP-binding protein [Steroidobacteraceae bacterium]
MVETSNRKPLEEWVLDVVRWMLSDMSVQRRDHMNLALDARLDQDLGLDSLSRAELISRVEREFGARFNAADLQQISTVRDLADAISKAMPPTRPLPRPEQSFRADRLDSAFGYPPVQLSTLIDVLAWHVAKHPDFTHITLLAEESSQDLTYAELWEKGSAVAAALCSRGLRRGDTVALMLPTCVDYFLAFMGILTAGAVPVPIYPPVRLDQVEDHLKRHALILENAGVNMLLASAETASAARMLRTRVAGLKHIMTVGELLKDRSRAVRVATDTDSLALLQYTSGSTGQPKGVMLTHGNLLANVRALGQSVGVKSDDVFVSWLPLYHDMGLIGAWMGCLYFGIRLVLMSPFEFLVRPSRWLWAISRYRGTISGGPNFAYDACIRRIADEEIEGLKLDSWRVAFNGAEAVIPETLQRFADRFAPHGFEGGACTPVYGLAESSVGLTVPPIGRGALIDLVDRIALEEQSIARPAPEGAQNVLRFVSCGLPLAAHQIRIVDDYGRELGDRREGNLQFNGPSATQGYYRNPAQTRSLMSGGWLNTGDRAYIASGELFVTGRIKDIIIRAGRHIYPQEIESAVDDVPGVRKGCVAVFGHADAQLGTERLIVMAETREAAGSHAALRERINQRVLERLGEPADIVCIVPPHTVLKTSSGKIRRGACQALYESTQGNIRIASRRRLALRLAAHSFAAAGRKLYREIAERAYGALFWALFALVGSVTWALSVASTTPQRAWRVSHRMMRFLVRALGIPFTIEGLENLPSASACILVSNHTSYLDSLFLLAGLPRQFDFIVKEELQRNWWARRYLESLGAKFVDRYGSRASVEDAGRLAALAQSGHSLLIFPEGTFTRVPLLMPFRLGAFKAAVDGRLPIVPCAIVGARSMMRDGRWSPKRLPICIQIGAPLFPPEEEDSFKAAAKLRDSAYSYIAARCGEPRAALAPR